MYVFDIFTKVEVMMWFSSISCHIWIILLAVSECFFNVKLNKFYSITNKNNYFFWMDVMNPIFKSFLPVLLIIQCVTDFDKTCTVEKISYYSLARAQWNQSFYKSLEFEKLSVSFSNWKCAVFFFSQSVTHFASISRWCVLKIQILI